MQTTKQAQQITFTPQQWQDAAQNLLRGADSIANIIRTLANDKISGQEAAQQFYTNIAMAAIAMTYVSDHAADKLQITVQPSPPQSIANIVPLDKLQEGRAYYIQSLYQGKSYITQKTVNKISQQIVFFLDTGCRLIKRYGKEWRAWDNQPTAQQLEETPW